MKNEDFLKAVRNSGEKLRVDRIQIAAGSTQVSGKGTVRTADNRFVLEVTLDSLVPWVPLVTNPAVGGKFVFTDTQSSNFPTRFCRGSTGD